jgi:hypothetical protein
VDRRLFSSPLMMAVSNRTRTTEAMPVLLVARAARAMRVPPDPMGLLAAREVPERLVMAGLLAMRAHLVRMDHLVAAVVRVATDRLVRTELVPAVHAAARVPEEALEMLVRIPDRIPALMHRRMPTMGLVERLVLVARLAPGLAGLVALLALAVQTAWVVRLEPDHAEAEARLVPAVPMDRAAAVQAVVVRVGAAVRTGHRAMVARMVRAVAVHPAEVMVGDTADIE